MHLFQWELALRDCESCLQIAPTFVKAHFRKGKAFLGLGHYPAAIESLLAALELKKESKEIKDALQVALIRKRDYTGTYTPDSIYSALPFLAACLHRRNDGA